jgi:hypothetical protein
MSFFRQGEIYHFDGGTIFPDRAPAHRNDEFPSGYSSAGCAPAEPASASPSGVQLARKGFGGTMQFQRTAKSALAVCLTQGDNPSLFSGYLGSQRCFIVIPQDTPVHIPSDLLGLTLGYYEENRSDNNAQAAVAPFCKDVKKPVQSDSFFRGAPQEQLRELCVKFQCCDWIKPQKDRIDRKRKVRSEIDSFCADYPVNKARLLMQHHTGYYIALLSAIRRLPEPADCKLIMQMKKKHLPSGFAYYALMDAIEALKASKVCNDQLRTLQGWLRALPERDATITSRINSLV